MFKICSKECFRMTDWGVGGGGGCVCGGDA